MHIKNLHLATEGTLKKCRTIGSVALMILLSLKIQAMAQNEIQIQTEPIQQFYPWSPDLTQVHQMALIIKPEVENVKARSTATTAKIDFARGSAKIEPSLGRNWIELQKVDTLVKSVMGNDLIDLKKVQLTGYSSVDGRFAGNEALAKKRSLGFANFISTNYGVSSHLLVTDWVAEDWNELERLIETGDMPYKSEILNIIATNSDYDTRENKIKALAGGRPWAEMLNDQLPKLRRIGIEVEYVVRPVPMEQIRSVFESRPALLSLEEMYRIAPNYADDPAEYQRFYETVARYYPSDVVANNNAAAAALLNKDVVTARYYLDKIVDDPRSSINRATLLYINGEREASRYEFNKGWNAGYGTRLSDKLFELTPIPVQPVVEPTPEPVVVAKVFVPRFAIKTNLLLLAGLQSDFNYYGVTPNLAFEYYFAKRYSVNVDGAWAGFKLKDSDTKERYGFASAGAEGRLWFRANNQFRGFYAGLYGAYSQLNTMNPNNCGGLGYSGSMYGGGVSIGYVQPLTPRLILEVGLRGGYRSDNYNSYTFNDLSTPAYFEWIEDLTKRSLKLQSINISIGYRFGKTK